MGPPDNFQKKEEYWTTRGDGGGRDFSLGGIADVCLNWWSMVEMVLKR